MRNQVRFETKIGWLIATEEDGWIVRLDAWQEGPVKKEKEVEQQMEEEKNLKDTDQECRILVSASENPVLSKLQAELLEYMEGKRKVFTAPYRLTGGTPFQRKVWEALKTIPYGETRSYREIAEAVGSPKACRAVGGANHNNPIMILVPCHRVIGADGKLVGFGGGLPMKKALLELEKNVIKQENGAYTNKEREK